MSDICFDNLSDKETRYDEMFLSILQNEGKIEPFLDTVFRFLYRRLFFFKDKILNLTLFCLYLLFFLEQTFILSKKQRTNLLASQ